jgi:DNA-binding HxlR family transcriptional regulator
MPKSEKESRVRVAKSRAPRVPGARVRGSDSGRPIMAAFDLLGQRWTMRILWELRHGLIGFRALRDASGGLSPTLLNGRLKELVSAGLVAGGEDGYGLTPLGAELKDALAPLHAWSERWKRATDAFGTGNERREKRGD